MQKLATDMFRIWLEIPGSRFLETMDLNKVFFGRSSMPLRIFFDTCSVAVEAVSKKVRRRYGNDTAQL